MGGTIWQEIAPYSADPEAALRQLQAQIFQQNYNHPRQLDASIASMQQAVYVAEAASKRGFPRR